MKLLWQCKQCKINKYSQIKLKSLKIVELFFGPVCCLVLKIIEYATNEIDRKQN